MILGGIEGILKPLPLSDLQAGTERQAQGVR